MSPRFPRSLRLGHLPGHQGQAPGGAPGEDLPRRGCARLPINFRKESAISSKTGGRKRAGISSVPISNSNSFAMAVLVWKLSAISFSGQLLLCGAALGAGTFAALRLSRFIAQGFRS